MSHPRVLVADDDPSFVRRASSTLQSFADVKIVATGTDVLTQVQRWTPDVVVLDMLLEDADCFSILEHLVQSESRPGPFVLCVTASYGSGVRLSPSDTWPVGTLPRCSEPALLRSAVLRALGDRRETVAASG